MSSTRLTKVILKATDAKLREDNWQYVLEVCDLVKKDPEDNGNEAVELIEERLRQSDANVILRTLSLTLALAENCGSRLKQKVDSKPFIAILERIINDSNIHVVVKRKVVDIIGQLSKSFKDDPSLVYTSGLYKKIGSNPAYKYLLNTSEEAPKVDTSRVTEQEERDFQKALKLSLMDTDTSGQIGKRSTSLQFHEHVPASSQPSATTVAPVQAFGTTAGEQSRFTIRKVKALYQLNATEEGELSFQKGDIITVLEQVYRDWWRGTLRGKSGIFPSNYVTSINEPTTAEKEAELRSEEHLISQKNKIDSLNSTLEAITSDKYQNVDVTQNPEINESYSTILPLRPQLAKTIGKYSQKKDDLMALSKTLEEAELAYNKLLSRATSSYVPAHAPTYGAHVPGPMPPNTPYPSNMNQHMQGPSFQQMPAHPSQQMPASHQYYEPPQHQNYSTQQPYLPRQPYEQSLHEQNLNNQLQGQQLQFQNPISQSNQTRSPDNYPPGTRDVQNSYYPQNNIPAYNNSQVNQLPQNPDYYSQYPPTN